MRVAVGGLFLFAVGTHRTLVWDEYTMIRRLVDFALNSRVLILALGPLLLVCGFISFHTLPVEAYPDVAKNYVNLITSGPVARRRKSLLLHVAEHEPLLRRHGTEN
jgi:hypothetical protein